MVTLMRSPDSPNVVEFVAQFRMFSYVLSGLVAGLDPRVAGARPRRLSEAARTLADICGFTVPAVLYDVTGWAGGPRGSFGIQGDVRKEPGVSTEIVHQQLPEERMKYRQRRSHKGTASRYDTSQA